MHRVQEGEPENHPGAQQATERPPTTPIECGTAITHPDRKLEHHHPLARGEMQAAVGADH